ncbi:MAG: hypothetical protein BGO07_03365 [Alphaproteobacteria bacterium 40-19]|nr:MAG: hypothetical protein BGO07_03365 [Alphaproteobacteria bacterium 40-19]
MVYVTVGDYEVVKKAKLLEVCLVEQFLRGPIQKILFLLKMQNRSFLLFSNHRDEDTPRADLIFRKFFLF